MLKEDLWARRMTAEIMMIRRNTTTENLKLLEEIQKNNMKEHEVGQEFKKDDGIAWEQDRITYIDRKIYISNNKKIRE